VTAGIANGTRLTASSLPAGFDTRFWKKVDKTKGCWLWTGATNSDGYGKITIQPRTGIPAHRVAYELFVGPIPAGLQIDHLCRVRNCVNPAHLEPVTPAENMARSVAARTTCKRGHEFTAENTYSRRNAKGGISRTCKTCRREWKPT
jgi:hypothetical protein